MSVPSKNPLVVALTEKPDTHLTGSLLSEDKVEFEIQAILEVIDGSIEHLIPR
jgi:hypothetical protein